MSSTPTTAAPPMLGEGALRELARQMRLGLEVQNRKVAKRLHRCCFIGGEAVSFLTSRGVAKTRGEATAIGQRMLSVGLMESIEEPPQFLDSYAFYRFVWDKDEPPSVSLQPWESRGVLGASSSQESKRWAFAPHTAHNSLVLDMGLATEIEASLGTSGDMGVRQASLLKLRERVRQVSKMNAAGWVKLSESVERGRRVKRYSRYKPVGDFKTRKTVGVIAGSPRQFLLSFFDLETRRTWEPLYKEGAVVEAIEVPMGEEEEGGQGSSGGGREGGGGGGGGILLSTPRCLRVNAGGGGVGVSTSSAGSGGGGGSSRGGMTPRTESFPSGGAWGASSSGDIAAKGRESSLSPATEGELSNRSGDDDGGGGNESSSTSSSFSRERQLQQHVSSGEGIPVARLDDPALQEVIRYLTQNRTELDTSGCGVCGNSSVIRMCACCGMLACRQCCGCQVYDYGTREVVKVCDHCYQYSSRIAHPGTTTTGPPPPTSSPATTPKHPPHQGFFSPKAAAAPVAAAAAAATKVAASEQQQEVAAAAAVADGKGLVVVVEDEKKEVEVDDGMEGKEEEEEEEAGPPDVKWARCSGCGENIIRTMDNLDDHDVQCPAQKRRSVGEAGSNRMGGFGLRGWRALSPIVISSSSRSLSSHGAGSIDSYCGSSSNLRRGRRRRSEEWSSTRIIYRTAESPSPSLVSPREVCTLQDAFCDEDGTVYVYEISVQHVDVEGSPGHVAAEVLFLGYVARALGPDSCSLSVISQMDAQSGLPSWMDKLVGDKGRFGLFGGLEIQPVAPPQQQQAPSLSGCGPEEAVKGGDGQGRGTHNYDDKAGASGSGPLLLGASESGSSSSTLSSSSSSLSPPAMGVKDFELLTVIGRGGFGKVYLVRLKTDRELYAMKVLNKRDLRRRNQIERTRTERKVMAGADHPFIVRLQYAFHTPSRVYLVMDFMQGGDLFTLMRRIGRMNEEGACLLVAEIALALQYLHDRDVLYRDLKPENILLGADGHIKLTDFGLCRYFEIRPPQTAAPQPPSSPSQGAYRPPYVTHSFCGTEEYMAPEVLLNQGHGSAVDWWCLGLCFHEMVSRRHPFKGSCHIDTLRNICAMDPMIEPYLSTSTQHCIDRLLRKNPDDRIRSLSMLQRQAIFAGLDWDAVYHKRVRAPYVPSLHGMEDTSSFSTLYTGDTRGAESELEGTAGGGGRRGMLLMGGHHNRGRPRGAMGGGGGGCFELFPFNLGMDASSLLRGSGPGYDEEEDLSFNGFDYARPEGSPRQQPQEGRPTYEDGEEEEDEVMVEEEEEEVASALKGACLGGQKQSVV